MSKTEDGRAVDKSLIDQDQVANARVSLGPSSVGTGITRSFRPALEIAIEEERSRREAIGLTNAKSVPRQFVPVRTETVRPSKRFGPKHRLVLVPKQNAPIEKTG